MDESKKSKGEPSAVDVIQQWTERDLTAAAAAGQLERAWEVDDALQQVQDVLASGRFPVLSGESGVGKTALIHELVMRAHEGRGPAAFAGKRVLQLSIRHRASALRQPYDVGPEMQRLVDAIAEVGDVVPFFRDIHLANNFDLEPQLQALGYRIDAPILGEGDRTALEALFEYTPELDEDFVLVHVDEPSLAEAHRILDAWCAEQARRGSPGFSSAAVEQALHLAHRFLARGRQPRKSLDLLRQTRSLKSQSAEITGADVIERFSRTHNVPRFLVDPEVPLDLVEPEAMFSSKVLGQPAAVRAVVQMIGLIKAGLSDVRRPFGVFLFAGPTGVGKTHLAQLLAEYLFGSRERMVRLNMADFQGDHDALTLFGNPDDGRPGQRRGMLTQRVAGHPFAVLLLDEFEKAHPKVHDRFLQLFDEGWFINGAGESVSCRSMILIATTNAGAEVFRERALGFAPIVDERAMDAEIDRRLSACFRFEFLNRFDHIVHFHPLKRESIRTIALRELEALEERAGLKLRGFSLEVEESVLDWLTAHGYDPYFGARFLRRTIERHVTTVVAESIVRAPPDAGTHIQLTVRRGRIVAQRSSPAAAPEREAVVLPVGTTAETRVLDRARLEQEARELVGAARGRLEDLEAKRSEAHRLLDEMNQPGFWDDPGASEPVLDRYRALDVTIRSTERLSGPLLDLVELVERDPERQRATDLGRLARVVESAAEALRTWGERVAEEGAAAVWLVLQHTDPLKAPLGFVADLARMELGWCAQLGLEARVVAVEESDEDVLRAVLEVEGPGASAYLAMEEGLHRMHRPQGRDSKVRVEVIERGPPPREEPRGILAIRRRRGALGDMVCYRARLPLPERGLTLELYGDDRASLAHLVADLVPRWADSSPTSPPVARAYAHDGVGARDPRTGVVCPRLKDVLKGRLDPFLEGWRRRMAFRVPEGVA